MTTAQKKIIEEFNKEGNFIVVTPYPVIKDGKMYNVTGVATYSYHLTPHLSAHLKKIGKKLIILCDKKDNNKEIVEDNILILPIWERGSRGIYSQIKQGLKIFNKVSNVLIHFEFNMYGEALITGRFPLLLLRIRKKNITLLLHQVAKDLTSLQGHLGIDNKVKLKILDFLHHWFYYFLLKFSDKIIVHDQILKERLLKISKKIVFVVPHGLGEYQNNCALIDARDYLGIKKNCFVILCFGFLTWYKGSDWIVDKIIEFNKKYGKTNIELIMAGGPSANLKDMDFYKKYYDGLMEKVKPHNNIKITGFVPDEEVHYYYCSADVVVLPYRTQMSASGPFAVAMSFDRPFLLSKNLSGVLETYDIKKAMSEIGFEHDDLLFNMKGEDFFNKLSLLQEDKKTLKKMALLSGKIAQARQWENISEKFVTIIDA
jgi:glycosyltransferase involved in cell wall biosynthesis